MDDRLEIRCPKCNLNQFEAERCRRCKASLAPEPEPPLSPAELEAAPPRQRQPKLPVFARRLRQARAIRGMSQARLAIRMGCPRTWFSKIETGSTGSCFTGTIFKIANALHIHPAFFLEESPIVALAILGMTAMSEEDRANILRWCERRAA